MPKIALTPYIVKNTICPDGKQKLDLFDQDCKGLMLEIRSTGGKTYYFRYQDVRGKTRHLKLADADDVSLSQARSLVDKKRNQLAMGEDPSEQKSALKKVPTVYEFIYERYIPFAKGYKRSWITDEGLLRNHVVPHWGKRYMDEITKQDFIKLITDHRKTHAPGSCNRLLILVKYLFNLAMRWEVTGVKSNPTDGFPMFEEHNTRERFLTKEEAASLYREVKRSENRMLQYIVPMLILTGARKAEVLNSKWEDFDLEKQTWRIPITKGGKARYVPLSDGAISLLNSMPRIPDCPYAFPNPDTEKPFVSIFYSWHRARTLAGLADLRIHDLRHSFASFLVNAGRSLYEVQRILGHTHIKTTQRYSHLSHDSLLSAANEAAKCVPLSMTIAATQPVGAAHMLS